MNDRDLVRLLLAVADSLEFRAAADSAGLVRQAARRIADLPESVKPRADTCANCGEPLVQPAGRGRPRRWCSQKACVLARKAAKTRLAAS